MLITRWRAFLLVRGAGSGLLGLIRSEPGAVSLESMLTEIDKSTAIRQAALVYLNTLMLQDVIDDPSGSHTLDRDADRRALTPLFWSHVLPYGEVRLDMSARLQLST